MQVLHEIRGKQPRPRTTKQHPALQVQLKQEVERVETRVGLQEDRRRIQGVRKFLLMKVWRFRQDSER